MQVNAALNLVVPIRSQDGVPTLFAYHVPISLAVFQSNYRLIAATKASIFGKGLAYAADAGPRIATLALQDAAKIDARDFGVEDTSRALLGEIKRLTHVLAGNGDKGFEMLSIDTAISKRSIDAEEWEELEAFLVFFTCGYLMARRSNREAVGKASALVLGGSMTSLPPMEYAASLKTSTPAETSASTIPS